MTDPAPISPRRTDGPPFRRPARIVREARFLAAANLGLVAGVLLWRAASKGGHAAQALTLAQYTANFATYRKGLIDTGRASLVAYVLVAVVFAIVAMVCYELLVSAITRFLGRHSKEPSGLIS